MVSIVPYISVSSAVEALELYKKIFGITAVERMEVGEEQAESLGIPEGTDLSQATMHASFKIGDAPVFMSDNFTGKVLEETNASLLIVPDSLEMMKEYYENAKDVGCTITMELEKQFWGDYFASFTDPFGIRWQLNFTPKE